MVWDFGVDLDLIWMETKDPFTAMHLDCIGSSLKEYVMTIDKLVVFVEKVTKEQSEIPLEPAQNEVIFGGFF